MRTNQDLYVASVLLIVSLALLAGWLHLQPNLNLVLLGLK
jgi:hypothetical protein